jgi:hypothetical protein
MMTLGVILALGLLELAAAAGLVHWELFFMSLRGEEQHYLFDAELGFRHTPSMRWSGRRQSDVENAWGLPASASDPITVTYDLRGYRNATQLTQADIILIGDSYVEGDYVSDDQIVSRFLQARLGQPVANLGVAGYGTAQELIVLKQDAMPLQPRIVIWFFFEGTTSTTIKSLRTPCSLRARCAHADGTKSTAGGVDPSSATSILSSG